MAKMEPTGRGFQDVVRSLELEEQETTAHSHGRIEPSRRFLFLRQAEPEDGRWN